jgi:large subunit ribosomal protein L18
MMKTALRSSRHGRVRSRIVGTAKRPRLVVFRGTTTVSAQLIDDSTGTVLASASAKKVNVESGTTVGTELAKAAKTKKIDTAVFDRAGYAYHGVVKAIAEAAREGGVKI